MLGDMIGQAVQHIDEEALGAFERELEKNSIVPGDALRQNFVVFLQERRERRISASRVCEKHRG
jgi:hypothetical protein